MNKQNRYISESIQGLIEDNQLVTDIIIISGCFCFVTFAALFPKCGFCTYMFVFLLLNAFTVAFYFVSHRNA